LKSNGLQFDVKEGSQAASVGEGKVVAIQQSDDGTKTVMVEHEGGYISVYGPLGTLGVKKGDAINKNTSLGKVYTKKVGDGPKTVLKFQIWKDNKAINPEEWLG
jgi:murein DD-endopeptidase MepM/ murein hydrolase activator NlpD